MKEIGMLFSTDMVREIIDGNKTVTRRLCKFPSGIIDYDGTIEAWNINKGDIFTTEGNGKDYRKRVRFGAPCSVGDRIYVRETWTLNNNKESKNYNHPEYYADYETAQCQSLIKWRPSIHMPKKYARIWLEITDIGVQQVKDITEKEAVKEGFAFAGAFLGYMFKKYLHGKRTDDSVNEILNRWSWVISFKVVQK